jgi:hypothetical protein
MFLIPLMRPWTIALPASRSHVPAAENTPLMSPGSDLMALTAIPGSRSNQSTILGIVDAAHDTSATVRAYALATSMLLKFTNAMAACTPVVRIHCVTMPGRRARNSPAETSHCPICSSQRARNEPTAMAPCSPVVVIQFRTIPGREAMACPTLQARSRTG